MSLSWIFDRLRLSREPHEVAYVKKLARKYFKLADAAPNNRVKIGVTASSLRRICLFILKTKIKGKK